jgi:copper chaperone
MSCGDCEAAVTAPQEDPGGVDAASADHEAGTGTVEGDADALDPIVAVQDAVYEAEA